MYLEMNILFKNHGLVMRFYNVNVGNIDIFCLIGVQTNRRIHYVRRQDNPVEHERTAWWS